MIAEQDFAGRQILGMRETQEDFYAFSDLHGAGGNFEGLLVVIADGMGGHNAGERASELAVRSFIEAFHGAVGTIARRLKSALHFANTAIAEELERDSDLDGMGTTLLAACITANGLEWISVGDSPLYVWHAGKLVRLNEDHSLRPVLRDLARRGGIPASEVAKQLSRNILRAALTGSEIELIDQSTKAHSLHDQDVVIAASDGIHTLNDEEIAEVCGRRETTEAREMATRLVRAMAEAANPKQDNITIAIMKPMGADEGIVLPL